LCGDQGGKFEHRLTRATPAGSRTIIRSLTTYKTLAVGGLEILTGKPGRQERRHFLHGFVSGLPCRAESGSVIAVRPTHNYRLETRAWMKVAFGSLVGTHFGSILPWMRARVEEPGGRSVPRIGLFAAIAAIVVATLPVASQEWPTRPVTIVVPLAAGGGPDSLARVLAPHLAEFLGQPVVVENVPGGGGMTGAARVAKATPDGYQSVIGNVGTHAQNQTLYKHPLYNAATDFTPVGLVAELPFVLVVRPDLPASNLAEFIAYAGANQAAMRFGSAGPGSGAHLTCMLFNAAIGINTAHIPYRSGASTFGMQDLIAGRIDYMCPTFALALAQIESNAVKTLAILTRDRIPRMPALKSADEQGLTGFDASSWNALFLPKDTPPAIRQKLNAALAATLDLPSVQTKIQAIGANTVAPERRSPEYLQQLVKSEIEKWAGPIRTIGAAVE
jgi:tripartite-type tricarboxylate transporter receptor subunit TctC